jgi:hypothetical protein
MNILYHKLSILLSLKSPKHDSIHRLGCYGMQMGYDRVYIEKIEFQFKYFEDFKKMLLNTILSIGKY